MILVYYYIIIWLYYDIITLLYYDIMMLLYYYIIIHRLRPPTATALWTSRPMNSATHGPMEPWSYWPIDWLAHFLQPKMAHFRGQNDPKMAPRWLLGGSWGHLGGKMAPRWSQEGFKGEKVNSFPPCWGPSWDPILDILITGVDYKRLQEPLGWHVVSRHQFLSENGSPGTPFGDQKSSQSVVLSSKIKVFGLPIKVALGRALGTLFGTILGPK